MGKGRIVAESTSPVGNGTAGLLLIKGMPPPLSGITVGTVTGELALGAGETAWRGRNGHGYTGEDDTTDPPEVGAGATSGGNSDDGVVAFSGGSAGVTFMESFCEPWHVLKEPFLKVK